MRTIASLTSPGQFAPSTLTRCLPGLLAVTLLASCTPSSPSTSSPDAPVEPGAPDDPTVPGDSTVPTDTEDDPPTLTTIDLADERLQYIGRWDWTDPDAPTCGWQGSSPRFRESFKKGSGAFYAPGPGAYVI